MRGATTSETPAMMAVNPSAMASERHSRRAANHNNPTPAVGLVRSTTDQVHGWRNPSTIAAAMSRCTLPWYSSMATGGNASTSSARRPPRKIAVATSTAIQSHRKTQNGTAPASEDSRATGGLYVNAPSDPTGMTYGLGVCTFQYANASNPTVPVRGAATAKV